MIQQLSLRMLAAMDMVSPGGVADIGTDHGYLAAALALDGRFSPVIATDVAELPLSKAKEYAKKHGLEDKIIFRFGDGLNVLKSGEVKTAVIAGMGGETIAGILRACPWARESLELVLQPMSRPDILRRELAQCGFTLVKEQFVSENGRIFCIMKAVGGKMPPMTPAEEMTGLLTRDDPLFEKYANWVCSFTEKALKGVMNSSQADSEHTQYMRSVLSELRDLKGE